MAKSPPQHPGGNKQIESDPPGMGTGMGGQCGHCHLHTIHKQRASECDHPPDFVLVQQGRHVGEACGQITSTPVPEEGQPYGEHDVPVLLASWRRRAIWSMTCCIMYTLQCADLWFPSCILFSMSSASGFSKSRMSISSGHVQMGPMVVPPKVAMSQTLSHFHKGGSIASTILNG